MVLSGEAIMTGFILAAGFGTRLRPLTDHIPKAIVPVCGEPLLARNLKFLAKNGFDRIGVNVHYLPDQMIAFQQTWPGGFELFHEQDAIRGTGGGIWFAHDFLKEAEIFAVCNVDILADVDLRALAAEFSRTKSIAMLVAAQPNDPARGSIIYDSATHAYRGVPKSHLPAEGDAYADFIGIALYRREFLDYLTAEDFSVLPVWQRMQSQGGSVQVAVQPISWYDAGTPAELMRIHRDVLAGKLVLSVPASVVVDKERHVAYPVTLPVNVRNSLGSFVWSDSVLIDRQARLRDCIVLADTIVSSDAVESSSILTPWGSIPIV
jgi:NDP-sugar pyrophosphorylase family protein